MGHFNLVYKNLNSTIHVDAGGHPPPPLTYPSPGIPKPMHKALPSKLPAKRNAFALMIALMLMGFIFLILISLGSLVRVQTQSATLQSDQTLARKNALLGLKVALGQLQELAGADQRITAPASVLEGGSSPSVPEANRNWIGVWDASDWNPTTPDARNFLGWLVSNKNHKELDDITAVAPSASRNTVMLLGGADPVELETVATNASGSEAYAFWIADESLKASVALSDPFLAKSESNAVTDQLRRTIAFKNDLNKLTALEDYDFNTENWQRLSTSLADWNMLPVLDTGESAAWKNLVTNNRHDFTLNATGLLTNTRKGGWKRDLSLAFREDTIFNNDDNNLVNSRVFNKEDYGSAYRTTAASGKHFFGPRWEILRDYHNLWKNIGANGKLTMSTADGEQTARYDDDLRLDPDDFIVSRNSSGSLDTLNALGQNAVKGQPILHNDKPVELINNPIAPVMTYFGLFFKVESELIAQDPPTPGQPDKFKVKLIYQPIVHMWNPYNVEIELPDQLAVRTKFSPIFRMVHTSPGGSVTMSVADGPGRAPRHPVHFFWIRGTVNNQRVSYTIPTANTPALAPGEIRAYSQSAPTEDDQSGTAGAIAGSLASEWNESGGTYVYLSPDNYAAKAARQPFEIQRGYAVRLYWHIPESNDYATPAKSASNYYSGSPHIYVDAARTYGYQAAIEQAYPDVSDQHSALITLPVASIEGVPYNLGGFEIFLNPGGGSGSTGTYAQYNPAALLKNYHAGSTGLSDNIVFRTTTGSSSASLDDSGATLSGFWGESLQNGSRQVYLYDIPRAPLHSIAQLQNATISLLDDVPAYAIGNSMPPAQVDKKKVVDFDDGRTRIDTSWLLNNELWDDYFFSTAPAIGDTNPATGQSFTETAIAEGTYLPNHRYRTSLASGAVAGDLYDYNKAAAQLRVEGAFNINSTSVDAWAAVLGSLGGDGFIYSGGNSGTLTNPFFRHGTPYGKSGDKYQAGWTDLTNTQIRNLAAKIVDEVKTRGPFMSVGDFVNRRLTDNDTADKGALQAAIDETDINNSWGTTLATLAPGYLSQADILSAIGPFITARGDTFLIRAYGCVRNPVTNQIESEAWLEATVRRVPQHVDGSDPYAVSNSDFGRRFVVDSFKWLTKDEL